jgi:hypothetical protein
MTASSEPPFAIDGRKEASGDQAAPHHARECRGCAVAREFRRQWRAVDRLAALRRASASGLSVCLRNNHVCQQHTRTYSGDLVLFPLEQLQCPLDWSHRLVLAVSQA